jgi:hypothetical protein
MQGRLSYPDLHIAVFEQSRRVVLRDRNFGRGEYIDHSQEVAERCTGLSDQNTLSGSLLMIRSDYPARSLECVT